MTKKYLSIIFVPVVLAISNGYISSYQFFSWGYDNRNYISIFLFSLSLVGCLYVMASNAKNLKSKFWYIFPSILLVIDIFIIYTIYYNFRPGF